MNFISFAIPDLGTPSQTPHSVSLEVQRFAAGLRTVLAVFTAVLVYELPAPATPAALLLLVTYNLWAALQLHASAQGRTAPSLLTLGAVDVAWTVLMMHATEGLAPTLIVALLLPTLTVSVTFGVTRGLLLASIAVLAVLITLPDPWGAHPVSPLRHMPTLGLLLVPAATLLARPMGQRHRQGRLAMQLEAGLDPRRGLSAAVHQTVQILRADLGALAVAWVPAQPATHGVAVAQDHDRADIHLSHSDLAHATTALGGIRTHDGPTSLAPRRLWGLAGGVRGKGQPGWKPQAQPLLAQLAGTLHVAAVLVVPVERQGRCMAWLVIGLRESAPMGSTAETLTQVVPDLLRLLDTAQLVDRLQDEASAHERARIGRDLHDSAIQPYLGLKFAVEALALRLPHDHPLRQDLDELSMLTHDEVETLRDLISGMRNGEPHGEDALVPAVQRQSQRFARLFGIAVHVEAPKVLTTRRALAGEVFHLLNEALNNVRRHTVARQVWVRLALRGGELELRVRDNAGSLQRRPAAPFVPRSLSERTADLGGQLQVTCPDGLDTELVISIPMLHSPRTQAS